MVQLQGILLEYMQNIWHGTNNGVVMDITKTYGCVYIYMYVCMYACMYVRNCMCFYADMMESATLNGYDMVPKRSSIRNPNGMDTFETHDPNYEEIE